MAQALATFSQVESAFRTRLKKPDRTQKLQEFLEHTGRKKLSTALIMSLGLRETWLQNILGGARLVNGVWLPEADPTLQDAGIFQISKRWHKESLLEMEAVKAGTWGPPVDGATAYSPGHVPSFRVAMTFVVYELMNALDYAREHGVPEASRRRFAVAAHNCGLSGALSGFRAGNVDKYTAGGDYSAWVLDAESKVQRFFDEHPRWLHEEG